MLGNFAFPNGDFGAKCDQGEGSKKGVHQERTLEVAHGQWLDGRLRSELVGPVFRRSEKQFVLLQMASKEMTKKFFVLGYVIPLC